MKTVKTTFRIWTILLISVMIFSAFAVSVSAAETYVTVVEVTETEKKQSTVYLGEIFVDGVSVVRYVYSDDVSQSDYSNERIKYMFSDTDAQKFADLMPVFIESEEEKYGIAYCSDETLAVGMDESWKNASAVGAKLYPDAEIKMQTDENLYDVSDDFKTKVDTDAETRRSNYEVKDNNVNLIETGKRIIIDLTTTVTDTVTYTVIDGVLLKLIERHYDYECEAVNVIYTSVMLDSSASSVTPGDVNKDGFVDNKDVVFLFKYVSKSKNAEYVSEYDFNGDNSVNNKDVSALFKSVSTIKTNG